MREFIAANIIGVIAGTAIGWVVLPQPLWIQKTHAKIVAWMAKKLGH